MVALLMAVDIQFIKSELNRLEMLIDRFIKESNVQSLQSDIQFIRVEQERQGKLIDDIFKNSFPICTTAKSSGMYSMFLPKFSQPLKVVCDAETQGGGWTIILRRLDGTVDFYRNWTQYQHGFGDLNGEFFMGLDNINALTTERAYELLVILEDFEGKETFERYEEFAIGNADQQYILHTLGKANGTAGDALSYHYKKKFSTFDRDNDAGPGNCAVIHPGAWCQLTGRYKDDTSFSGINWLTFHEDSYSLKKAIMMIRPRR
ncbi:ficolin-2-like [Drosophila innubila]|uniref:ficolin-2-like n=1 Tax=Drosophila innubila TaxID=198719 RepID=UPI00148CB7C3|nr:ficolin-2-like [Drosophila innubila]